MVPTGSIQRRLCVAVDARAYGTKNDIAQLAAQRYLVEFLDAAGQAAGLRRTEWQRQPGGDAEFAVLPPDEPEETVIDRFIPELDACLRRHNDMLLPESKLHLRVAIHFGRLIPAVNGWAGPAPVEVNRLLNSQLLREALATAEGANLAVLLSEQVFTDTVEQNHTTLRAEQFRKVSVDEKEFHANAWLWVPGHDVHRLPLTGTESPKPKAPAGAQTVHTTVVNGPVSGTDIVFGIKN